MTECVKVIGVVEPPVEVVGVVEAVGPRGLSAYEVAVAEGFEGSEAEWLQSLAGADGVGVPAGGTTRQALIKASDADFDTKFETLRELPTTPLSDVTSVGAEFVLTTNNGTPPVWEARGQIPVPGVPGPEGAVRQLAWAHNTPAPTWEITPRIPYAGTGTGLPRHTLIIGDGGSYRWVQEDPIPTLPDESGQFLGVQDGALAWLHPIPPAIAGTDPQTLTIPANTPTEVAKNLCPNPTAIASGAAIGSPANPATTRIQGVTLPEPTPNGTTTGIEFYITTGSGNAGILYPDGISATPAAVTAMVYSTVNAQFQLGTATPWITVPANTWTQLPTTTHGAAARYLVARSTPSGATTTDRFYYTEIRSGTATNYPFFTGDTPPTPTTTYQWDGPPHNSPSTKYAIDTTTQWTPITLIPPPPPTGTHTLTTTNGTITWEEAP